MAGLAHTAWMFRTSNPNAPKAAMHDDFRSSYLDLADADLFRVRAGNRDVLRIPSGDKALQVRLMVCGRMRSAGHRGVSLTLCLFEGVLRLVSHLSLIHI